MITEDTLVILLGFLVLLLSLVITLTILFIRERNYSKAHDVCSRPLYVSMKNDYMGMCNQYIILVGAVQVAKGMQVELHVNKFVNWDVPARIQGDIREIFDIQKLSTDSKLSIKIVEGNVWNARELHNTDIFDMRNFIQPISFSRQIHHQVQEIVNKLKPQMVTNDESRPQKLVVIHLKTGIDSIQHYSMRLGCSTKHYRTLLDDQYKMQINRYINEDCIVYICVVDPYDPLVTYIRDTGAKVIMKPSNITEQRREINSAIETCVLSHFFKEADWAILPFNRETGKDSSFSSYLIHKNNFHNIVEIDLELHRKTRVIDTERSKNNSRI